MNVGRWEVVLLWLHEGYESVSCNDECKEDLFPPLLKEKGVDVLTKCTREREATNLSQWGKGRGGEVEGRGGEGRGRGGEGRGGEGRRRGGEGQRGKGRGREEKGRGNWVRE